MLRPNVPCEISKTNNFDINGTPQFKPAVKTKCKVVRFKSSDVKTSVRADSSASRGRAQEEVYDTLILLPKTADISLGDRMQLYGEAFKVVYVEKRLNVFSKVDHYEVALNQWV